MKKALSLLLAVMLVLSLAACGTKDNDKMADMSGDSSAMTGEPRNHPDTHDTTSNGSHRTGKRVCHRYADHRHNGFH